MLEWNDGRKNHLISSGLFPSVDVTKARIKKWIDGLDDGLTKETKSIIGVGRFFSIGVKFNNDDFRSLCRMNEDVRRALEGMME